MSYFISFQPPEEFQSAMVQSIRERAATLQDYVETIMDGLQSVASTLVFRKVRVILSKV